MTVELDLKAGELLFSARRACRGMSMVHSTPRYKENTDNLGDALLDLMHYCVQNGKDFDAELAWARKALIEDQEVIRRNTEVKS